MTFDAAWQQVTCRECRRTYQCTPEDDYFGEIGGALPDSATSGLRFACSLRRAGLDPETTAVKVVDPAGRSTDPRDLARRPGGAP